MQYHYRYVYAYEYVCTCVQRCSGWTKHNAFLSAGLCTFGGSPEFGTDWKRAKKGIEMEGRGGGVKKGKANSFPVTELYLH